MHAAVNAGVGVDHLTGLHDLLQAAQVTLDLQTGLLAEELRDHGAELPAGWVVAKLDLDFGPPVAGRAEEADCAEIGTSASPTERHEIRSFGTSVVISASHSTVLPAGARAVQRDRRSSTTRTDSRCSMKRGRFWKSRQKR